jgi:ParB-like chromosome segregation protein Spo0J
MPALAVIRNPRRACGDIDELAADIAVRGLLEPLVVNDREVLIDGHRRLCALKQNNATNARCLVAPGLLPGMNEEATLVVSLHKKLLTPLEEGVAYAEYLRTHNVTTNELGWRLNKVKGYVENRLRLTRAPRRARKTKKRNNPHISTRCSHSRGSH